jgi:hypothetical protein
MRNQHITPLIARYIEGQLRPAQRVRVVNHVRTCAACRAALAHEERLAADLRREMPGLGARAGQLATVWAGVWQDIHAPRSRRINWLPGLSVILALVLVLAVALPVLAESGLQTAPPQARPINTATPDATETSEPQAQAQSVSGGNLPSPQATVALVRHAGATPAPMPAATVSPEAQFGGAYKH